MNDTVTETETDSDSGGKDKAHTQKLTRGMHTSCREVRAKSTQSVFIRLVVNRMGTTGVRQGLDPNLQQTREYLTTNYIVLQLYSSDLSPPCRASKRAKRGMSYE